MGERNHGGLTYVAGLDGLRALAVVTVMLFHLGWDRVPGGAFGVSLFFTLSGYLITQLMVGEHDSVGRVDLKRFWSRRLRRLGPGSLVCLIAVAIATLAGVFEGPRLQGDLIAGLGYAANWRFANAGTTYAQLFESAPSPILHFWSLAIEEQFYVIFPLLMIVLLKRRRLLVPALVILTVVSTLALLATSSRNLAYYGTHTRAAELLVGALLALALPIGKEINARASRALGVGGVLSLGAYVYVATHAHTQDAWLYQGGLSAFSLLSATMIVAVLVPGPMRYVMSSKPLVFVGKITYSLYLFHWPVFVALNEERMGFGGLSLSATRLGSTFLCALLSAWLIENPIRFKKILRTPRWFVAGFAGASLIGLVLAVSVSTSAPPALAGLDAPDEFVQFAAATPTTIVAEKPGLKILALGSESQILSDIETAVDGSIAIELIDGVQSGCAVRVQAAPIGDCRSFLDVAQTLVLKSKPDVVVLGVGATERKFLEELVTTAASIDPGVADSPELLTFKVSVEVVEEILQPLVGIPVIVVDYGDRDVFNGDLEDADLRMDDLLMVRQPDAKTLATELFLVDDAVKGRDQRKHVMVIGDSTSFGLSAAINDVAGDRYSVLWAGGRNCPLVEAEKVRWWDGAEFDMGKCPTLDPEWLGALDSFAPEIVLAVYSVPEQSEQMYRDDPNWYTVADEVFVERHTKAMSDLMFELDARDIDLWLFDSPEIHGGALGGAQFASPERVVAWNAVMDTWRQQWSQIRAVDWSAMVAAAEPTPGALREDGVHMLQEDLDRIVGNSLVPLLDSSD